MTLTPRDKRMLQILGAVAGVAVVFLLVTRVLGGGGGDEGEVALPTGPTAVVPTTAPTVSPVPEPSETLPPVVLAGARDPFSTPPELVTAAVPTGTSTIPGGGGTTTTTSTTVTTTTSPSPTFTFPTSTGTTTTTTFPTTTTTTTTSTTTGPGNGDGNGNEEPTDRITMGEHELRLVGVDAKQGRVEILVDRRLWTVEEGGTFDEVFKLVKIDGKCARFLFGDDSFTLCLRS